MKTWDITDDSTPGSMIMIKDAINLSKEHDNIYIDISYPGQVEIKDSGLTGRITVQGNARLTVSGCSKVKIFQNSFLERHKDYAKLIVGVHDSAVVESTELWKCSGQKIIAHDQSAIYALLAENEPDIELRDRSILVDRSGNGLVIATDQSRVIYYGGFTKRIRATGDSVVWIIGNGTKIQNIRIVGTDNAIIHTFTDVKVQLKDRASIVAHRPDAKIKWAEPDEDLMDFMHL